MITRENVTASEPQLPEGVSIHEVKECDGRLLGHILIIGSLEVIGSLTPLLLQFGVSVEGFMETLGVALLASPAVLPVIIFVNALGTFSLISLEDHLKRQHGQA